VPPGGGRSLLGGCPSGCWSRQRLHQQAGVLGRGRQHLSYLRGSLGAPSSASTATGGVSPVLRVGAFPVLSTWGGGSAPASIPLLAWSHCLGSGLRQLSTHILLGCCSRSGRASSNISGYRRRGQRLCYLHLGTYRGGTLCCNTKARVVGLENFPIAEIL
jgi:hypothetical protein